MFAEGNYKEAIPLAEKAIEIVRRERGPEDPDTATSLNNLAELYRVMGNYAKAEPLYQEALRIRSETVFCKDKAGYDANCESSSLRGKGELLSFNQSDHD